MFIAKKLALTTATRLVLFGITLVGIVIIAIFRGNVQTASAESQAHNVQQIPGAALDETRPLVPSVQLFLPLVMNSWPPIPAAPVLNTISNTDKDSFYSVSWGSSGLADYYTLEEATDVLFSDASIVYQGASLSWSVSGQGQTPSTYYYRVTATNSWGTSSQSNIQSIAVHPLFIGLNLRWDGVGYIRFDTSYDVGTHLTRVIDILTDVDTIRSNNLHWYDPDPQGWGSSSWYSYYSVSTAAWKSSSVPGNPDWKWGNPWILEYGLQFSDGQTVLVDNQSFIVTGPHAGVTAFGKAMLYWELINRDQFLFWDAGGDWKQYVHPGDVVLWYDAGNTRLLMHSSVMRRSYYQGNITSYTVQYIENLTSSNSFPSSLEFIQAPESIEELKNLPPIIYLPEHNVNQN